MDVEKISSSITTTKSNDAHIDNSDGEKINDEQLDTLVYHNKPVSSEVSDIELIIEETPSFIQNHVWQSIIVEKI